MDTPESSEIDVDRIEDKYILSKEELPQIKQIVDTHLPPYFPEPETIYCINTSIYFDSPDLTFLRQHLAKLDSRRKIRIRTYAPNGTPNHVYFMEVKSKNDGESTKTRVQLSETGYQYAMQKHQVRIDEDLFETNIQVNRDDVIQHANLINYLLLINKAEPVVEIMYKRYAHQESEDLRVTMDSNIRVKPLEIIKLQQIKDLQNQDLYDTLTEYGSKFSNADDFILEVKHKKDDDLPQWLQSLIDKVGGEQEGFSKYVWAMAQIVEHSMNMVKK